MFTITQTQKKTEKKQTTAMPLLEPNHWQSHCHAHSVSFETQNERTREKQTAQPMNIHVTVQHTRHKPILNEF